MSPKDKEHTMTKRRFNSISFVIALAGFVSACSGQSGSTDDDGNTDTGTTSSELDQQSIADIEALADTAVAAGIPGVSIAIVRGKQNIAITRGVADQATGEMVSTAHRFRMASMAKSLVAAVVLQLVDEGKLKLADPLGKWLPGTFPAHEQVPLELLIRQESGLFDFTADDRYSATLFAGDLEHAWTPGELLAMAAEHAPTFAPGARFEYSNTNYAALAVIIEHVTGKSLDAAVRERIFEPLGMNSSSMVTTPDMSAPFAHGYMLGFEQPLDATRFNGSAVFGCGNIVSVPLDMARFYGALAAGKVVSKRLLPVMLSKDPNVAETDYTMGLFRWNKGSQFLGCDDFVGHPGGIPGYDSQGYSSVDGRRQFAIAVNSFTVDDKAGEPAAQQAYEALVYAIACK
jgi:D-alanyl-D-alanine carboxypeptidase